MKTYRSTREVAARARQALDAASPTSLGPSALEQVAEILHQSRHYFWVGIFLVLGDKAVRYAAAGPQTSCSAMELGHGNVGTAAASGALKVSADVSRDATYVQCFAEVKSELVAPIRLGTQVFGVLDLESDQLGGFGEEERILAKQVAADVARFLAGRGRYIVRRARRDAGLEVPAPRASTPRPQPQSEKPESGIPRGEKAHA
ncbi:MAG TPA: GAF domain-containing protein [Terriglobales bacterium]|nr:GAF domain-containing protein [Terriglobales bacterium]